jgi:hypothetical protein
MIGTWELGQAQAMNSHQNVGISEGMLLFEAFQVIGSDFPCNIDVGNGLERSAMFMGHASPILVPPASWPSVFHELSNVFGKDPARSRRLS